MANGVSENVEVFGRVFHVETRVVDGAETQVRTSVALDDAVVATRDSRLYPGDDPEVDLRELIESQHARIISNLLARDVEFEVAAETGVPEEQPTLVAEGPASPKPTEISLPGLENDPDLHSSVNVRRLIGPFSLALRPSPDHDPSAVCARLARAAEMVAHIMGSPSFPDIRLDEQVRFVDLQKNLEHWESGDRDPEQASKILLQMMVFAGHLRRISDRRSLKALDHTLLTWALFAVGPFGTIDDVLPYLEPLYGRDVDLDRMLDEPDSADPEQLHHILKELLERTQPVEA
jgi:hypothetical protein